MKQLPTIVGMLAWIFLPVVVAAGSASYATPGTYSFSVPAYGSLTVQVWGGGGAGGGFFQYAPGGPGGTSSFGNALGATGGSGGAGVTRADDPTPRPGGPGGAGYGGDSNLTGGSGLSGSPGEMYVSACGGVSGAGGSAPYGGVGGAAVSMTATGNPGIAPGGGASGGAGATMYSWPEGGGNYFECAYAGGGGGGGYAAKAYSSGQLTPGSTVTVVVGSGGVPWLYNGQTYNAAGGYGASGRVTISWTNPPPASCSVSLSPNPISQGQSSTLSWSATNADSYVYIQSVGYVSGSSGTFTVAPSGTTDYSCYASGTGGSDGWHGATLTVYQSCALPWGGSIGNGQSTTAYQASTVPYGSSCTSQTRTCNNGTLSGSYQYQSCSVTSAASCTLNGVTVADGSSRTFYSAQTGSPCSVLAQSRSCSNGVLSGSASYQYGSCACAPIYSCAGNTITHTDSSCITSSVTSCTSPYYCSPGTATCISPEPSFTDDGTHSGHLQAVPLLVSPSSTTHLYWNVSNVSSCTVTENNPLISDSWTGLSGSHTTSSLFSQTVYTLHCVPFEGATFTDESVTVNTVPIFQEL